MKFALWKAARGKYSSEDRQSVCIEPDGKGVVGYVCRVDASTWIIENDVQKRTFQTENEAAATLVKESQETEDESC
jgi:hypothetical protein